MWKLLSRIICHHSIKADLPNGRCRTGICQNIWCCFDILGHSARFIGAHRLSITLAKQKLRCRMENFNEVDPWSLKKYLIRIMRKHIFNVTCVPYVMVIHDSIPTHWELTTDIQHTALKEGNFYFLQRRTPLITYNLNITNQIHFLDTIETFPPTPTSAF